MLVCSYVCLVCYGCAQIKKSAQVKKSTLQLLRRVNQDTEIANELYENAMANI